MSMFGFNTLTSITRICQLNGFLTYYSLKSDSRNSCINWMGWTLAGKINDLKEKYVTLTENFYKQLNGALPVGLTRPQLTTLV